MPIIRCGIIQSKTTIPKTVKVQVYRRYTVCNKEQYSPSNIGKESEEVWSL